MSKNIREILEQLAYSGFKENNFPNKSGDIQKAIERLVDLLLAEKKKCKRYGGEYHDEMCGCDTWNACIDHLVEKIRE